MGSTMHCCRINRSVALVLLIAVAGCGTVEDVQRTTIEVDGRAYTLETREITTGNRSFNQTAAVVRQRRVTCLIDSPGDCEAAVREARSRPRQR